jgi:hypothetical protein
MGKELTGQLKICEISWMASSPIFMGTISLFRKFIFETLSKSIKVHLRFLIGTGSQEENKRVSSAYYRATA